MYRNGRKRRGAEGNNDNFKTLLILTGSVLAIAVITFIITYSIYNSKIKQDTEGILDSTRLASLANNTMSESASSEIGKTVNQVKNEMNSTNTNNVVNISSSSNTVKNTNKNNTVTTTTKNTTNTTSAANTAKNTTNENSSTTNTVDKEVKEEVKKDPTFIKPVEGEIIRDFAKDNLVYSQTLDEWITHLGIDIKADKTTVVKAAADGVVETIKNDPRYGLTVIISHDNGYKTVYSNLLTSEFVTEGENIKSGQTIGTVGNNAAFEISDDPHLHFEMTKDNEKVDPKIYIKF